MKTKRCLLAIVALVAGCGEADVTQDEGPTAEETAAAEAAAAQAAEQAEAEVEREQQAAAAEAEAFIRARLGEVDRLERADGYSWSIEIISLSETEWRWRETEVAYAVGRGGTAGVVGNNLTYSVNPSDLSARVGQDNFMDMPAVKIECRSGDCIHVTGISHSGNSRSNDVSTDNVDRLADQNYWPVRDAETRNRLAAAMADLLALQGATVGRY